MINVGIANLVWLFLALLEKLSVVHGRSIQFGINRIIYESIRYKDYTLFSFGNIF